MSSNRSKLPVLLPLATTAAQPVGLEDLRRLSRPLSMPLVRDGSIFMRLPRRLMNLVSSRNSSLSSTS